MMSSENSQNAVVAARAQLRAFGLEKFGTMKGFASGLGITPQNLNGYLSGERNPGRLFLSRLAELGFDISGFFDTHERVSRADEFCEPSEVPPLRLLSALKILGDIGDLARAMDASPERILEWADGKGQPSHRQLAILFNDLTVASAAIAKTLSDASFSRAPRPDLRQGDAPKTGTVGF